MSETLREKYQFARRILERLILEFADQQLVTGFALLISAWVKLHSNSVLESLIKTAGDELPNYYLEFPNRILPNAEFSLIVFLCMASSSSHLACILVLRDYMESHRSSARLRITLIIIFACFLAVTIALGSSLTAYFAWIITKIFLPGTSWNEPISRPKLVTILALCIAIPLIAILAIFYLCTMQLSPRLKGVVQTKLRSMVLTRLRRWLNLSRIWHSGLMRLLPARWRKPFTNFVKRVFWFIILGNESVVFALQVVLAVMSVIWISLQRLSLPPEYWPVLLAGSPPTHLPLCSLHNVAGKGQFASFGQLLPLIFLVLPLFSVYGAYIEEKDRVVENRESQSSPYTTVPVSLLLSTLEVPIVILTTIQSAEPSPQLPRKSSRKQKQSQYQDESELSLLSPHPRNDSEASSATGIGIQYGGGQSPPPRAYSIGLQGFQGQGTLGWPSGYGTGVDEENASSPVARH